MGSRSYYFFKVIAVNLLLCLLVLGGAELLTRGLDLAPEVISIDPRQKEGLFTYSDNPKLGYLFTPNFSVPAPAYDQSFFRTNSEGLRDIERRVEGRPGWRRIIVLGDSVVSAVHTNVNFTIARQLEHQHEARGRRIESLNMGVMGYCTRAEVELLETKGLRYDPDLVILVFVENDYRDFNEDLERALEYERPPLVNGLFKSSELFRLFALRTDAFEFRTELMPEERLRSNRDAIGAGNVPRGLKRLKELSRRHNFQVVIALWPVFRDDGIHDVDNAPEYLKDPDDERLTIERLAAEHGFEVVRLSDTFREDYAALRGRGDRRSPRMAYTIGDEMHPMRTGTFVAARALLPVIDRLLPAGAAR